jgi:hypothetical protein
VPFAPDSGGPPKRIRDKDGFNTLEKPARQYRFGVWACVSARPGLFGNAIHLRFTPADGP